MTAATALVRPPPTEAHATAVRAPTWTVYWSLTKPDVNVLILVATGSAFFLGSLANGGALAVRSLAHTLVATLLVASGAATLNQFAERAFDARMQRTARRPLPAGRLDPFAVLQFGV